MPDGLGGYSSGRPQPSFSQISFDSQSGPANTPGSQGLTPNQVALFQNFNEWFQTERDVDPSTGQKLNTVHLVDRQDPDTRFGGPARAIPASPSSPAWEGAAYNSLKNSGQNARLLQGLSPRQAIAYLYSLDEEQLTQFQRQMVLAGMYEKQKPIWGMLDDSTIKAFSGLMKTLMNHPEMTVAETLEKATRGFSQELANQVKGEDGSGSGSKKGQQNILLQPEITDAATLADMVNSVSQELFGKDLGPDRLSSLVSELQQKQKDEFYATTFKQAQNDIANSRTTDTSGGSASDVDIFMNAIMGQESGGDPNAVNADSGAQGLFQIMPENWVPWAREAGVDPNDHSAANQKAIAKFQMQKYYQAFGNWRDVAIAWYAGPGAVGGRGGDASQGGYPTINSYADQAVQRYNSLKNQTNPTGVQADPTLDVEFRNKLDTTSEARAILRAANPTVYEATKFARQAKGFFSLLAGV